MRRLGALALWGLLPLAWATPVPLASQDTTVVRADNPPAWGSSIELVEEVRIGLLEGDDRYIFGEVAYALTTPDGSIWVVDGQGPRVRIYDHEGRWVRDVARPGEGPGEIASVMEIDLTPDGRVAIWDLRNARVSLYRPDGAYDRAFRVVSGSWRSESFQVDRSGRFWAFTSIMNPECVRTYTDPDGAVHEIGSEGPGCETPVYLRFTPEGEPLDTVAIPQPETAVRVPSFVVMLPEGNVQPFVPRHSYALSPLGYFVTVHSMRYALHLPSSDGSEVMQITRESVPVRLSSGERDDWQGRVDFYDRTLNPNAASYGVEIPDLKPAVRSIAVDRDGRIWVNRYVEAVKREDIPPRNDPDRPPALTWREPPTFDVIEPSGRFLGTVVVPWNTRMVWSRGDVLLGIQRGEFDETYVVRYRIEGS